MKKSFASRRVPRKIGGDEEDQDLSGSSQNVASGALPEPDQQPAVVKRSSKKNRKSSAFRTSFGPSQLDDHDDDGLSEVIIPKKSNLSRLAVQRNAERHQTPDIAFRQVAQPDHDRPSYSKDYLDELKQSTPSTPKDNSFRALPDPVPEPDLALQTAGSFGTTLSSYQPPTAIPTDAEIAEKKARRARLAKEQEFISLEDERDQEEDDDDDDNTTRDELGRLVLKPKEKYAETRLVRDDEDMLEGFDEFTTDARIDFGSTANKVAAAKRKAEMASLIAQAEGHDQDDSDDDSSEAERNAAFEVTQTRHGKYAAPDDQDEGLARPRTPPRVLPITPLESVVERLRTTLQEMELTRMMKSKEMQRLVEEKAHIGEEEVRVQAALKELGEYYARLREQMRGPEGATDQDASMSPDHETRPREIEGAS